MAAAAPFAADIVWPPKLAAAICDGPPATSPIRRLREPDFPTKTAPTRSLDVVALAEGGLLTATLPSGTGRGCASGLSR